MTINSLLLLAAGVGLLAAGCEPSDRPAAASSQTRVATVTSLPAPARATFSDLPVPPKPEVTAPLLERGKSVYAQNCLACHGAKGDGKGDAAAFLLPKPRNFVQANYRLRSTPASRLPTDADLFRSVSLGLPGTPMPPWRVNLSEADRWAVVEYIKAFSPRFADSSEDRQTVLSLGTPPAHTDGAIAEGKALFTKLACITCHGETGHGDGTAAVNLVDDSQTRIKPRDFSRPGMFKSGYATKEIVRTILPGLMGRRW